MAHNGTTNILSAEGNEMFSRRGHGDGAATHTQLLADVPSTAKRVTFGRGPYLGRLLRKTTAVGLTFLCMGCTALPGPLKKLPTPFGPSAKEQALRKQVEADSFPTARQAGL
jgi:hypothetical protein